MGRWQDHRRLPVGEGQTQFAVAGRSPAGQGDRRGDAGAAVEKSAVHVSSVTAQSLPSVSELLHRRWQFRFPYRQRGASAKRQHRAGAYGFVRHAVLQRAGGLRRRRAGDPGHLRHPTGEAACRRHGAVSRHQSAQGQCGDTRSATRLVFLDAKPGA
ncbi:hypothetical protein D9M69_542480 [compost metagenome]